MCESVLNDLLGRFFGVFWQFPVKNSVQWWL